MIDHLLPSKILALAAAECIKAMGHETNKSGTREKHPCLIMKPYDINGVLRL